MKHIIATLLLALPLASAAQDVDYACKGTGDYGPIVIGVWEYEGVSGMWEDAKKNVIPSYRAPSGTPNQRRWITSWGENFAVITVNTANRDMDVVWVEPDNAYTYRGKCRTAK